VQYEPIQPGLFRLQTPAGALTVPATEDELIAAGHTPLTAPGSLALAQMAPPGAGGGGNAPASRLDAGGGLIGGPGSGAGGAPAQNLDQDIFEGAPNAPEMAAPDERLANPTRETRPLAAAGAAKPEEKPEPKAGTKTIKLSLPSGGGRGGSSKPSDVLVGYTVKKSGLRPDDVEANELAQADASIDRKLSAQNIAERKAAGSEAQSAAMGRDIRREEQAVEAQRARDAAMAADYKQRQSAIDNERTAVDQLKVNPREYFDSMPAWARVLSGISVIGAGVAGGMNGSGRNSAMEAINAEVERNIDAQKHNIAGRRQGLAAKENELERLTKLYGSPQAAEAELRDRQRSLIQNYAIKQALDAGATDAADNLRTQFADWDTERAKNQLALRDALAGTVEETHKMAYAGAGGPAKPKHLSAGQEKVAGLIGAVNRVNSDIAGIEGRTSTALPEESDLVTRAKKGAYDFFGGKGTYERNARTGEENETTRRLQLAKATYKGTLSQATEQGVVTGPEQSNYENAIDAAQDAEGLKRTGEQILGILRAKAGAVGAPDVTPEQDFEVHR
jgi:hypothetical protein